MQKWETAIVKAVRKSTIKDVDDQQDCMQYVRLEILRAYKNHKKYDDFTPVVRSVIARRISDFGKKYEKSHRNISENRINNNRDDDHLYSIENEPEICYTDELSMEKVQNIEHVIQNDSSFNLMDIEIYDLLKDMVEREDNITIDKMTAEYYGYDSLEEYLNNNYTAPPTIQMDGSVIEYEPDRERQRKTFISRLSSFKNKLSRSLWEFDNGFSIN